MNRKIIGKLFIISVISILSIVPIYAEDVEISIDPIFTQEDGLWYPSRIESKDFNITNNKDTNITIDRIYMDLKSIKNTENNQVLNKESNEFKELTQHSTVTLKYKDKEILKERLDKIVFKDGVTLRTKIDINSNEKSLLNMTIDMDEEMNNDTQTLECIFSIGVGYKIDDTNPTVKPETPVNPPTNPGSPVKPGTEVGSESDKLPQTGGILNSASLICIGAIAIGTGLILNKKSSKGKGGKYHE